MIYSLPRSIRNWIILAGFCLAASPALADSKPEELKVHAQLIWGTNEDKAPDPSYKAVDPKLAKKLENVFKWKNYFQVKHESASVLLNKAKRVKLSSKCEVEITNYGKSNIEAKLFGEGKFMVRKRQTISAGETLLLGGDAKDGNAWFVVLTAPSPKN